MQQNAERQSHPAWCGALAGLFFLVFAAGGVWVDYTMFDIRRTVNGEHPGPQAYLEKRLGLALPAFSGRRASLPERDYNAQPLTLDEKARLAKRIEAALPSAPEGWILRGFRGADFYRLRPDLAHCAGQDANANVAAALSARGKYCPLIRDGRDVWIYENGDRMIAVHLRYTRGDGDRPAGDIRTGPISGLVGANFGDRYRELTYMPLLNRQGFNFGRLPRRQRQLDGTIESRPERVFANRRGDGEIRVFVVANAPRGDIRQLLMRLDFDLLNAMLAPVR